MQLRSPCLSSVRMKTTFGGREFSVEYAPVPLQATIQTAHAIRPKTAAGRGMRRERGGNLRANRLRATVMEYLGGEGLFCEAVRSTPPNMDLGLRAVNNRREGEKRMRPSHEGRAKTGRSAS